MEDAIKKSFKKRAVIVAVVAAVYIVLEAVGIVHDIKRNREIYEEGARYSETVKATIVKEDELWAIDVNNSKNDKIIYKYTYSYSFGGKTYERRSYDEVNVNNRLKVNDTAEIKINPDSPEDFYDPRTSSIGKGRSNIAKDFISIIAAVVLAAVIIAVMRVKMKKKLASAGEPAADSLTDNQNNDNIQ